MRLTIDSRGAIDNRNTEACFIRLRNRRRRLGRVRARIEAVAKTQRRAFCCSKPGREDRSIWIHMPIGYGKTMWDSRLQLVFSHGSRAEHERTPHLLAARQDAGWIERD